jgi:uncharacterized protein DUF669
MPLQPWSTLLNDAEDGGGWDVLPAADYDLKVIKSEATQSGSGKLMYRVTHEVINGPYLGRKVFDQIVVVPDNPTALSIFFRKMGAMGIDKQFFAQNPSDHQVAEALLGKTFRGQVAIRQYQGQDKNEVKNYAPLTAQQPAAPPVPPQPTAPATPQPAAPVAPQTPPQPATPVQAAAVTPPAATPPKIDETPEPPAQPVVPPVPDTAPVAAAPVAPQPEAPPAPPPTPQPTPAPTGDAPPPPPF